MSEPSANTPLTKRFSLQLDEPVWMTCPVWLCRICLYHLSPTKYGPCHACKHPHNACQECSGPTAWAGFYERDGALDKHPVHQVRWCPRCNDYIGPYSVGKAPCGNIPEAGRHPLHLASWLFRVKNALARRYRVRSARVAFLIEHFDRPLPYPRPCRRWDGPYDPDDPDEMKGHPF